MSESLEDATSRLMRDSSLVRAVTSIRQDGGTTLAIGDAPLRQLYKPEIDQLESLGSIAEDWSRVRVAEGFNPRRVRNCEFRGDVVLGEFKQQVQLADRTFVIAGLSNCTLANCVIGKNSLIRDVSLLANYVVAADAVVVDCGQITCKDGTTFGNGVRVAVALEGGGGEIEVFAEMDISVATMAACPGVRRPELDDYRRIVAEYRDQVSSDRGIIENGARVCGVRRIEDTYVGPGAQIDGATCISRVTLLSSQEEPVVVETGAMIVDSLVQWGCRVTGMALVERSVLIEQARVERHGKVMDSVIGPNTEIAAGEVNSCLVGPFVGCHHQSLLISTLWPGGRGNVAYGANIGSNHTSRAPDQELWAGEGLFFGLGVNVKFPCDFSRAPYTVIACGVNVPPQKVAFPFSLIAPPKENYPGVSRVCNQITPAWMLCENLYALMRNELKFGARNRSKRHKFDLAVLRRENVEHMQQAMHCLTKVESIQSFYTEREIYGLGKNVMVEADRKQAIDAYQFFIGYYALLGLRKQLRNVAVSRKNSNDLLTASSLHMDWEHQRQIIVQDLDISDIGKALNALSLMALRIAKDCEKAREKDTTRGMRIIDDYADVHPSAERDRIVRQMWEEADRLRDEAAEYVGRPFVGCEECIQVSHLPSRTILPKPLPR